MVNYFDLEIILRSTNKCEISYFFSQTTGGRNGYGAKLCNVFSTKFIVETADKKAKKSFKQTWGSNMSKAGEPKIKVTFFWSSKLKIIRKSTFDEITYLKKST